jgi:hypothetical protein
MELDFSSIHNRFGQRIYGKVLVVHIVETLYFFSGKLGR